jgi:hypothetical protein
MGVFCVVMGFIGFVIHAKPFMLLCFPLSIILIFVGLDGIIFSFSLIHFFIFGN